MADTKQQNITELLAAIDGLPETERRKVLEQLELLRAKR